MIRMVVFDMAGTTVDEDNVVYKTLRTAINEKGFTFSLNEVLADGAGKEKRQAVKSILERKNVSDEALIDAIFARFMTLLDDAYQTQNIAEQPNATALFHALRKEGIRVVLNTGYNRQTAQSLVERIGWKKNVDIDALVTASDVAENRPSPDMILLAMRQFGLTDGAEVAKVGDSIIDVEEGRNAGCGLTVGITTGAHTYEQLQTANPDYIISDLMELLPIVEKTTVA